jgi:SAM-dependent methyltransferase
MPCAYDDFAWFYARYWNEEFHDAAFPILERIWLPLVPRRGRVLDVCCGTGYLARLLTGRGYRVAGLDLSPKMAAFARKTAPKGAFFVANASNFALSAPFDAAVSTFDSLNHILDYPGLEAAFRNTAAALEPGAPFAFDVLFEEAYRTRFGEGFAIVRDNHVLTITGSRYSARDRIAQCRITMFRLLEGRWRRSDAVIRERCYAPAEIDRALHRAGFEGIRCYDARDLGMGGQLGAGRTFYVATKRARSAGARNSSNAQPSSGP